MGPYSPTLCSLKLSPGDEKRAPRHRARAPGPGPKGGRQARIRAPRVIEALCPVKAFPSIGALKNIGAVSNIMAVASICCLPGECDVYLEVGYLPGRLGVGLGNQMSSNGQIQIVSLQV